MPSSFVMEDVAATWKYDYMFMAAVDFIKSVSLVNKQHCGLGRLVGYWASLDTKAINE